MTTYELMQNAAQMAAMLGACGLAGHTLATVQLYKNARKNYALKLAEKTDDFCESVNYENKHPGEKPISHSVSIETNWDVQDSDKKTGLVGLITITPRLNERETGKHIPFVVTGHYPADHTITKLGINKNNYRGITYYTVHDNPNGLLADRAPFAITLNYQSAFNKMQDRAEEIGIAIAKKADVKVDKRTVKWKD